MLRKTIAVLAAVVSLSAVAAASPSLQRGWALLGQRAVTDRADHDVIAVTAREGTLRQIKLTVQRASVDFKRVIVHYANGDDQTVEMRHTIRAGGETRAIDLEGNDRVVKSAEFWYDANTRRGRQAVVRLLGKG